METNTKQPLPFKFTWKEKVILDEVRRRIRQFKEGNKDATMVFLGFPYEVKTLIQKNVLTPYGGREHKRVLNWYNLTETGKQII